MNYAIKCNCNIYFIYNYIIICYVYIIKIILFIQTLYKKNKYIK